MSFAAAGSDTNVIIEVVNKKLLKVIFFSVR